MKRRLWRHIFGIFMIMSCLSAGGARAQEPAAAHQAEASTLSTEALWQNAGSHELKPAFVWQIEQVDSNAVGNDNSLALSSSGWPHISYRDFANDDLKYAYKDGSGWHVETIDSVGRVGAFSSLALDSADRPHISYYDATNGDLKYAWHDGTTWHLESVDMLGNVGGHTSLALDADRPNISYYDFTNGDLKYTYKDASGILHRETIDGAGANVGMFTSLAIGFGYRHISYLDFTNKDLKYARYDGSTWHVETLDSSGDVGYYTSLALCTTYSPGAPRIYYWADGDLKLAYKYIFGGWSFMAIVHESPVGIAAALDSSCLPHVSYYNLTNGDLRHYYQNASGDHLETLDDDGDSADYASSLALDVNDLPHISYYDDSHFGLSYASQTPTSGIVSICDESHLLAAVAGGGTVTFSCSGTITLSSTITIASDTTIDGSGQNVSISGGHAVRLFRVPAGSSLTLRNLSLVNGRASSASGGAIYNLGNLVVADSTFESNMADAHGGAILNYGTLDVSATIFFSNGAGINGGAIDTTVDLSVRGSTFTENTAGYRGGAINNYLGSMTVEDSFFAGNSSSGYGGGLVNDGGDAVIRASHVLSNTAQGQGGGIKNSGVLEVQDSTFTGNMSGGGGGIGNDDGELNVSNSTFSGNAANYGGGIQNTNDSYVVVRDSIFADNSAPYGGGGVDNDGSSLNVSDSSFVRNSVTDNGGGIYNHDGTVDVSNCTFSDNTAFPYQGGGIYNSSGTLNVSNSTFSGNTAETAGGGIFNSCCASASTATVSNSTFSGNSRNAISNYSMLTLKNTIVANSLSGGNCYAYSPITNGGGNLSFGDNTCPGIYGDPKLGPLQNNGGPTQTMALGAGSAAIDAAVDATCAAAPVNGRDQRGVTRPQGERCDIGAYEATVPSVPTNVFLPIIGIAR